MELVELPLGSVGVSDVLGEPGTGAAAVVGAVVGVVVGAVVGVIVGVDVVPGRVAAEPAFMSVLRTN